jgi:hypothetical protein
VATKKAPSRGFEDAAGLFSNCAQPAKNPTDNRKAKVLMGKTLA